MKASTGGGKAKKKTVTQRGITGANKRKDIVASAKAQSMSSLKKYSNIGNSYTQDKEWQGGQTFMSGKGAAWAKSVAKQLPPTQAKNFLSGYNLAKSIYQSNKKEIITGKNQYKGR